MSLIFDEFWKRELRENKGSTKRSRKTSYEIDLLNGYFDKANTFPFRNNNNKKWIYFVIIQLESSRTVSQFQFQKNSKIKNLERKMIQKMKENRESEKTEKEKQQNPWKFGGSFICFFFFVVIENQIVFFWWMKL